MRTIRSGVHREALTVREPKRLSKLGQWMQDNPGGLGVVVLDRRAVNK